MNYVKLQAEIIKLLDKQDKRNHIFAGILKNEDIAVTLDTHALYKIPKNKFYIDINKIPDNQLKADSLFDFDTEFAAKTTEAKIINKTTLIKLKSENAHTWIDEKLLRFFDKDCSFELSINKPNMYPIKVFEGGECVGIVLPFKVED